MDANGKIIISEDKILNFIAWCHHFTYLTSNLTSRAITAATHLQQDDGIAFDREQHIFIRRLLSGYQSLRLPGERMKFLLSECHIQKIFMYCVDINKYTSLLPGCAIFIRHSLLLRPVKIRYHTKSDEKSLYSESVT